MVLAQIAMTPGETNAYKISGDLERDQGQIHRVKVGLVKEGYVVSIAGENTKNARVCILKLTFTGFCRAFRYMAEANNGYTYKDIEATIVAGKDRHPELFTRWKFLTGKHEDEHGVIPPLGGAYHILKNTMYVRGDGSEIPVLGTNLVENPKNPAFVEWLYPIYVACGVVSNRWGVTLSGEVPVFTEAGVRPLTVEELGDLHSKRLFDEAFIRDIVGYNGVYHHRVLKTAPELMEYFEPHISRLIAEYTHRRDVCMNLLRG